MRTAGEDETMDFQDVLDEFNWEDLYPLNKSLGQDMRRLFQSIEIKIPEKFPGYDDCTDLQQKFHLPQCLQGDVVSDDFQLNGVEVADLAPKEQRPRAIIKVTQDRKVQRGECVFCRNNGESVDFYTSHLLKDRNGRVTCPILRAYVCPICGTSGDDSHTIRYCPLNKNKNETASIVQLKKMRKSVGVRNKYRHD